MNILSLGLVCIVCITGGALAQAPATSAPEQSHAKVKDGLSDSPQGALAAVSGTDAEVKALEACVGAEQAKTLREQAGKRMQERMMKAATDPRSGWLLPSTDGPLAWAETRYNECIKRENPDLQVSDSDKPIPCAAEYTLVSEARKLAGQEARKNFLREFAAASLPVVREERVALIAELNQLCAASPAK